MLALHPRYLLAERDGTITELVRDAGRGRGWRDSRLTHGLARVAHGHAVLDVVLDFDPACRKYVGQLLGHVGVSDGPLYAPEHLADELAWSPGETDSAL